MFAKFQTGLTNAAPNQHASRTIPTFLTLYIFGFLYQLLLAYDALRLKNTIQVIGLCLFNLALLLYAAVQMDQIHDAVGDLLAQNDIEGTVWSESKPFLIAIPCVIAVGTVLLSVVAWKLYDEFAWTIYKHISADLRMKRRYLTFQIYIALLKFDFFLFIGFTIQFVVIVVQRNDIEFWLTIAAIPVTILILVMAGIFTGRETRVGMAAVIVSCFLPILILCLKLGAYQSLDTLLRRLGLFHFQAGPNVSTQDRSDIPPRSEVSDHLRRHHNPSDHRYHCQCDHVYVELRQRPQATHRRQETGKRR